MLDHVAASSLAAIALVVWTHSRGQYREILQPRDYASASGEYVLHVDPAHPRGLAPARCSLSRGEETVWARDLSFSFWRAAVSDLGQVAGYAAWRDPSDGEVGFRIVLIDASGSMLRDQAVPQSKGPPFGADLPRATGLWVQDELGTATFRVADADSIGGGELWQTYDLQSGAELSRSRKPCWAIQALGIPGTPLTIVQWQRPNAGFELIDPDGAVVWQLRLPSRYERKVEPSTVYRGKPWLTSDILGVAPGRFEVHDPQRGEGERVRFEVANEPGSGWVLREVSREPDVRTPTRCADVPAITLAAREPVRLESGEPSTPSGPIRDIAEYALLPDGTIEFVRREGDPASFSLVHVDSDGRLVREQRIDPLPLDPPETGGVLWERLEDGDWLAIHRARAWRVDVANGRVTRLAGSRTGGVEGIAAVPGGGYVAVGTEWVALFGADGRSSWRIANRFGSTQPFASAKDVAVTSDGRVVVVDCIRKAIRVFDLSGADLGARDLAEVFGREPTYPSGIEADVAGGVLVHDFDSDRPLWRLDAKMRVRSSFDPVDSERWTSGKLDRRAKVAPDGTVWSTDGRIFVALDENGPVERHVGDPPSSGRLYDPAAARIDVHGRLAIQDERTGDVHVFDRLGRRVFVAEAQEGDVELVSTIGHIALASDGSVRWERDHRSSEYVSFAADGSREGMRDHGAERITFAPDGTGWWGLRDHEVVRLDPTGQVTRVLGRRPDRRFFHELEEVAVARDGSLAVIDVLGISLFDAGGEPIAATTFPEDLWPWNVARTNEWVAVYGWTRVENGSPACLLLDMSGGALRRFVPEDPALLETSLAIGFSPDGDELWLLEAEGLLLHRFALPE